MAKPPTTPAKPTSAIDAAPTSTTPPVTPTPAAPAASQPWAAPETTPPVPTPAAPLAGSQSSEPPAGTPMTPEERAANGLPPEEPAAPPEIAPIEDKLTLGGNDPDANAGRVGADEGFEPTGGDGRPDGFIPGDQTAAGALTPPGGQKPGAPKGLHPGQSPNLQDPYNVNGTARNQELLAAGHGIKNPLLDAGKAGPSDEDADGVVDKHDDK